MFAGFIQSAIKADVIMARGIIEFLTGMAGEIPEDTIQEAVEKLNEIIEDMAYLLNQTFEANLALGNASRLSGKRSAPLTPQEAIEVLGTTLDLMSIEVEALLRDKPGLTEEQAESIRERRDFVIGMMGHYARFYRASIKGRHPEAWTEETEKRFEKYLKIGPFIK